MPQLFFKPKYVWFPLHLKGHEIPDPSGQLAELIVYITSTRVDLYSHQILLLTEPFVGAHTKGYIKTPRHRPLSEEFTGDRWVPRTMGQ